MSPVKDSLRFLRDIAGVRWSKARGRYKGPSATGLRLAVVTAHPPSVATLTEYGQHLVAHLADKQDVRELLLFADDGAGVPDVPGATVVPAWRFNSMWSPFRLIAASLRYRPDVVYFNAHFTSFGTSRVAAAVELFTPMLLRAFGIPTVVLLHNLVDTVDLAAAGYESSAAKQRILKSIGRTLTQVLLRADRVVTTMPEYVEILEQRYGAKNVFHTPHGSFDEPAPPKLRPAGPLRILTFGKFGTYKRVEVLLEACALLKEQPGYEDAILTIAGGDSPVTPGYLASVAARHRNAADLVFTGYVPECEVGPLFQGSHVVAFPYTATTGSSGPLHQAGAHGCAVVIPDLGDFVGLVTNEGFVGHSFTPNDARSLARALADAGQPETWYLDAPRNHAAAVGLPLREIADWHVRHARVVAPTS